MIINLASYNNTYLYSLKVKLPSTAQLDTLKPRVQALPKAGVNTKTGEQSTFKFIHTTALGFRFLLSTG